MKRSPSSARSGLWQNRDFRQLWAAETISVFGSLVTRTALPFTAILVLDATPSQMALLASADLVPGFLTGLVAGVWVDRLRRRPLLIAADVGRAALLATIPAAAALHVLHIAHLYVVAFLAGVLTTLFEVAYQSYLPSVVSREALVEGNSKLTASAAVAEVGAFSLGGWLVQVMGAPIAILLDAFSFIGSAWFVGRIRSPEAAPVAPPERTPLQNELAVGMRTILADPILTTIALSTMLSAASFRIFGTVILLFTNRELGFAPSVLGVIFAVGGVSSLVGALAAERTARRAGLGLAMVGGMALMGVSMLFVPLARGATLTAAALLIAQQLIGDGAYTVYEINQVSLRQAMTPNAVRGRVNAGIRFVGLGAALLGTLLGGSLGETFGLRTTLVVGSAGTCLAALLLLLSPVRAVRTAPGAAHDV